MEADEQIVKLLHEIRDAQREHLSEYRRVTQRSLELQEGAVARQAQFSVVFRRIALYGGVLVAILLTLLVFLLVRWAPLLFR